MRVNIDESLESLLAEAAIMPEQRLAAAVMIRALSDVGFQIERGFICANIDRRFARTALKWFFVDHIEDDFMSTNSNHLSFQDCCDALGLDPKTILRRLKRHGICNS